MKHSFLKHISEDELIKLNSMLEQSKYYLPIKPNAPLFIYFPWYLLVLFILGAMIWMIIALKQDREEEEKMEWINSHLPIFLFVIIGIILLSFVLRGIRSLLWLGRLHKRQKYFEECIEVYNECGIVDKKYEFKTAEDRLQHQTAQ